MRNRPWKHFVAAALFALVVLACGGSDPICDCQPSKPDSVDFRFAEKHIPLPSGPAIEITVNTMLSWPQQPVPTNTTPRTGRELQFFHISQAYLQAIWLQPTDCDFHLELSETASKTAPRVIVETPRDSEYCPARRQEATMMQNHGMQFLRHQQEVATPFPVSVTGMAFEDFEHGRGSVHVATLWELHPAIVQGQ
jgi:hypothetical protein